MGLLPFTNVHVPSSSITSQAGDSSLGQVALNCSADSVGPGRLSMFSTLEYIWLCDWTNHGCGNKFPRIHMFKTAKFKMSFFAGASEGLHCEMPLKVEKLWSGRDVLCVSEPRPGLLWSPSSRDELASRVAWWVLMYLHVGGIWGPNFLSHFSTGTEASPEAKTEHTSNRLKRETKGPMAPRSGRFQGENAYDLWVNPWVPLSPPQSLVDNLWQIWAGAASRILNWCSSAGIVDQLQSLWNISIMPVHHD